MVVNGELFCHAISYDCADGQAVMPHHFTETVKCRRLHLEIAYTPALVVEGFNLAVVLGISEMHP